MTRILLIPAMLAAALLQAKAARAATPEQYLAQCRPQFETFVKHKTEDEEAFAQHFQVLTTERNVSNAAEIAHDAQAWSEALADIRANGVNSRQITPLWNNPAWYAGLDTVAKVQVQIADWQAEGSDPRHDRYHQAPPMLCTLQIRLGELQTAPAPAATAASAPEPQFGGGAVVGGAKATVASEPQFGGGAMVEAAKGAATSEPQFGGGATIGSAKSAAASEPQFGGGASMDAPKAASAPAPRKSN